MFPLFSRLRPVEQQLLAPLLELARARHGYDRRIWLEEMRADAPTVAARLEAVLQAEEAADVVPIERPDPARDRVRAIREVPFADSASRSSVA